MGSTLKALFFAVLISVCHACHKGKVLKNKGALICDDCGSGTFMPEDNNNKTECYPCTELKDNTTEDLIKGCSIEEDAVIICKPGLGLFRMNNICKECAVCEDGYELQACNGDRNTVCCASEKYYFQNNSDGVKVCKARTMPCREGQFFVSKDTCEPCPTGTYMAENHHNNTACNPCGHLPENLRLDGYVAMVCNITQNSTSAGNDHDGPCQSSAPCNGSLLSGLLQNCLNDLNKKSNDTDPRYSGQSAVDLAFHILILGGGILSIVIWLMWFFCETGRNKLLLPLIKILSDKKDRVAPCLVIISILMVVCYVVTLTVQTENAQANIVIRVLRVFTGFCVGTMIGMGSLYILQSPYMSARTYPECGSSLCGETDRQEII